MYIYIHYKLSPEGEVKSGGYIPTETLGVEVYILRYSPTLRGIVVLVFKYQIRWIKKRFFNFFFSLSFAKRHAIFLSVHKTVNIQGYSKLRQVNPGEYSPAKTGEYPSIFSRQIEVIVFRERNFSGS